MEGPPLHDPSRRQHDDPRRHPRARDDPAHLDHRGPQGLSRLRAADVLGRVAEPLGGGPSWRLLLQRQRAARERRVSAHQRESIRRLQLLLAHAIPSVGEDHRREPALGGYRRLLLPDRSLPGADPGRGGLLPCPMAALHNQPRVSRARTRRWHTRPRAVCGNVPPVVPMLRRMVGRGRAEVLHGR